MKYRKKTVIIEAEQYKPGMEDGFSCIPFASACRWKNEDGDYKQCMQCKLDIPKKPFISTPEWRYYINDGDWIITEVDGGRYLCNPNMFEMTYEPVEDDIGEQQIELDVSMNTRVRCGNCHELLYDPLVREHYLEMTTDEHGNCPGCGTVYYLSRITECEN